MNDERPDTGLSDEELAAQGATALPDKEVVSILDLNADIDLAIDAAAPIDLAVAANANVAAPIDAPPATKLEKPAESATDSMVPASRSHCCSSLESASGERPFGMRSFTAGSRTGRSSSGTG